MIAAPSRLATIAAYGLANAPPLPIVHTLPTPAWEELLAGIDEQRLSGLVLDAVARGDAILRDDQYAAVRAVAEHAMTAALRLESLLLVVQRVLEERDLEFRALKGPSCAHLDYAAPEHRSFVDVDILVRGDQFDAVADALVAAGLARRFDEPRPGFTARFGKGVCFTAPTGLEVDVHRALTAGPFGLAGDTEVLWQRSDAFLLGERRVACLAREERAVAAAVHACLGSAEPRLVPLRDVAQILHRGIDEERLVGIATELGVASVLARAILLARTRLGLTAPLPCEAWALGYTPSSRERRMLRAYTGADRTYAGQMLTGALAVKGTGARAAYLRALAFPSRNYLAARDAGYGRRVRRAARLASGHHASLDGNADVGER